MKPLLMFLGLTLLVGLSSCDVESNCRTIAGPIESRELLLAPIEGIATSVPTQLIVRQDTFQEIILTGNADLLDYLENRIENGIWKIGVPDCYRGGEDLIVEASLKTIRYLGVSGAAEVTSENFIEGENLELSISGSANMDIAAVVDQLDVSVSGQANVTLEGEADQLDYRLSGAGNLFAFDLLSRETFIRISGSGGAEVSPTELLDVRISGSGTVKYKGTPSTVNQSISGSGSVEKVE